MDDITKIVTSLEDVDLLVKSSVQQLKMKHINKKAGLLGTLGASLFENMLSGKGLRKGSEGVIRACEGVIRTGNGTNKVGQDF